MRENAKNESRSLVQSMAPKFQQSVPKYGFYRVKFSCPLAQFSISKRSFDYQFVLFLKSQTWFEIIASHCVHQSRELI